MSAHPSRGIFLVLLVLVASAGPIGADGLTEEELARLVRFKVSEEKILATIESEGIAFAADAAAIDRLRNAGASEKVLAALRNRKAGEEAPPAEEGKPSRVQNLVFVLDASAAMQAEIEDSTKMEVVRDTMADLARALPDGIRVSFVIAGGDESRGCEATAAMIPLTPIEDAVRDEVILQLAMLAFRGERPLARALELAGEEMAKAGDTFGILVVTSGGDSCAGDPIAVATELAADAKLAAGVNVLGFAPSDEDRAVLEKVAAAGRGRYFHATSVAEFQAALLPRHGPREPAIVGTGRRALRVAEPGLELPRLVRIAIVAAGRPGPGASYYQPLAELTAYGREVRLPSAEPVDIWWEGEGQQPVRMVREFSLSERQIVEIYPDSYLAVFRFGGGGLEPPELLALTPPGSNGPDGSYFQPIQTAGAFEQGMVVPAGTYDLWYKPKGGESQKIEAGLEFQPGKETRIE